MGTYTANYNLFMPSVGEQGWGDLVNGNFSTIDTYLKPISLSGSTYTFTGNQTGGSISATSISNGGTLTSTGKITANGGIGTTSLTTSSTITSTGKITGNGGIGTTSLTTSSTITSTGLITANGGIKGNLTGKINVSSSAASGDIAVYAVSYANPSISSRDFTTSGSATCSTATVTMKNTSIINYTGSTSTNSTCTITVTHTNPKAVKLYGLFYVTVVNNTTGTTIINAQSIKTTSLANEDATSIATTSFTRVSNNTYTITVVGYACQTSNGGNYSIIGTFSVATSTPSVTRYAS